MEKILGSKMQEFFTNLSKEDQQNMMSRFEKMATMCPCMGGKDISEEDRKKIMEKMMACCGSKMEQMSGFFKKTASTSGQACCAEKA